MDRERITIIEVARLARVSMTTVSRVINNQRVGERTKEKVLKVIEVCEYHPNSYAQYLGRMNGPRFKAKAVC